MLIKDEITMNATRFGSGNTVSDNSTSLPKTRIDEDVVPLAWLNQPTSSTICHRPASRCHVAAANAHLWSLSRSCPVRSEGFVLSTMLLWFEPYGD